MFVVPWWNRSYGMYGIARHEERTDSTTIMARAKPMNKRALFKLFYLYCACVCDLIRKTG